MTAFSVIQGTGETAAEHRQITGDPWERRPDETPRAFEAFGTYRDLGPGRSIAKALARLCGDGAAPRRLRQWQLWSARFNWRTRAIGWDEHLDAERRAGQLDEIRRMNERHIALAQTMLELARLSAERHLRRLHADWNAALPAAQIGSLLKSVSEIERLARGVPTEIQEVQTGPQIVHVKWGDRELPEEDGRGWEDDVIEQ